MPNVKAVFKSGPGGTGKTGYEKYMVGHLMGEIIFSEGDIGTEMFIIQSGTVELLKSIGGETRVLATLDVLSNMLNAQTASDQDTSSLLTEIRRDDPRLGPRVDRLRDEHADLQIAITSLRDQLAPDAGIPVDTSDIRDRLASLARRLRAQRARESDLVYEAVNIDLGVGD